MTQTSGKSWIGPRTGHRMFEVEVLDVHEYQATVGGVPDPNKPPGEVGETLTQHMGWFVQISPHMSWYWGTTKPDIKKGDKLIVEMYLKPPAPPEPEVKLGPLAMRARRRPKNYGSLPGAQQWEIDKELGILDWDGDPTK